MGKSIKLKNDYCWDSSCIMHNTGNVYWNNTLKSYLPCAANGNTFYGSTHYMLLGTINCNVDNNHGYASLTLLISSAFYGNQHYSTYIVSFAITQSVNAGGIKLMGNQNAEQLYFNIESSSKINVYAYVEGGNSYGAWNTVQLNNFNCNWKNERVFNVTKGSSWQAISTPKVA